MARNAPPVAASAARVPPQPATAQPPGKGHNGRRDHAGEHDGNHDERGLGHDEHCDRRGPERGEQPPAPLGQAVDPSGHLNIWIGLRIRLERVR